MWSQIGQFDSQYRVLTVALIRLSQLVLADDSLPSLTLVFHSAMPAVVVRYTVFLRQFSHVARLNQLFVCDGHVYC